MVIIMNDIKIAFFDIDGTLIDMERKVISEKMVETLLQLKKNHIIICIATGRTPIAIPQFEGVQFDAFLTFNGSYCFDQKKEIFCNPISEKDVQTIIKNASEIHRPVSIATVDKLAANGKDQDLIDYFAFAKLSVEVAEDFAEVAKEDVFQIMMGCYENEYQSMMKKVENAKITAWWDRAVDIIPANGGKGVGIEKVLEYYHLKKEDAIAFGDGDNDIEMLQAVGLGIAMENASDKLKEAADEICGHVNKDGIYYYCVEHGLIERQGC